MKKILLKHSNIYERFMFFYVKYTYMLSNHIKVVSWITAIPKNRSSQYDALFNFRVIF